MAYESNVANDVLVTPFDNKAVASEEVSRKLTPEEFCKKCYCKPRFEKSHLHVTDEIIDGNDSDCQISYGDLERKLEEQRNDYRNFETWLHNYYLDTVYTISGNAGTGKTTFIHYCKYICKDIRWVILDVHEASGFVDWMTDIRSTMKDFEKAQSKVYACIMKKIWELIFHGIDCRWKLFHK